MQRIYDPTAQAALPAVPPLAGTIGFFTGGVPGVTAATRVRAWWLNMLQEELIALLAAAGIAPDTTGTNFTQILAAVRALASAAVTTGAVPLTAALIDAALGYVPVTPTALDAEAAARSAEDGTLAASITAEAATRLSVDNSLLNQINAEAAARGAGDSAVEAWVNGLNKPIAAATSAAGGQSTVISATVTFTAPGPGWLHMTASRNYSNPPTATGEADSYLNGVLVCSDNTFTSVTHTWVVYTGGGAVSAQINSTSADCDHTAFISLLYVPYI